MGGSQGSLSQSVARLRVQAIAACIVAFFTASTLPAVEYYYLYQHDHLNLGPQAWGHWSVVLVACLLVGVLCFRHPCRAHLSLPCTKTGRAS